VLKIGDKVKILGSRLYGTIEGKNESGRRLVMITTQPLKGLVNDYDSADLQKV
jgi:hypothetical protein